MTLEIEHDMKDQRCKNYTPQKKAKNIPQSSIVDTPKQTQTAGNGQEGQLLAILTGTC